MRLLFPHRHDHRQTPRSQRASAVLVVLVLLACMVLIAMSNSATLHSLKQELKFIDRQQQERHGQSANH